MATLVANAGRGQDRKHNILCRYGAYPIMFHRFVNDGRSCMSKEDADKRRQKNHRSETSLGGETAGFNAKRGRIDGKARGTTRTNTAFASMESSEAARVAL